MAILDGIFGGRSRQGGMSPLNLALLGVLAYRTLKGKGRLSDMLGRSGMPNSAGVGIPNPAGNASGGGLGDLLGGLGGLFGGAPAGSAISDGLGHLLERLRTNGQGDKAQSWVAHGANTPIDAAELEQGLGQERMQWLLEQTGLSRNELLAGLSRSLPETIDRLTPDGRLPSSNEVEQQLAR